MIRCPAGHESAATDYCDVCGAVMTAAPEAPVAPAGTAPGADCPHCGAVNPADALFCENCGYDFTTGTPPAAPAPADPAPADPAPAERSADGPSADGPDASAEDDPDADATGLMPAVAAPEVAPAATPAGTSPAPRLEDAWVAEVWIDPEWYASQGSADRLPSPGLPTVVRLRHTSCLIGRTSRSRGIAPDVDVVGDSGVSRRHAQLTTDGSRWFVEDLGSANGTFVGDAGGSLPRDPVAVGQKQELASGSRLYLGAWTRIVLRPAAEGE